MGVFSSALGSFIPNPIPASPIPVIVKPKRQLDDIVADAILEEQHQDDLQITDHPVEQGAIISDHAYKLPVSVILVYGFTESSHRARTDPNYLKGIYQKFLTLQGSKKLVDIYTGKRLYTNMLVQSVLTTTDKQTEHTLVVRVGCREVIITTTQVLNLIDQSKLAIPEQTTAVQNQGTKQLAPVTLTEPQGLIIP